MISRACISDNSRSDGRLHCVVSLVGGQYAVVCGCSAAVVAGVKTASAPLSPRPFFAVLCTADPVIAATRMGRDQGVDTTDFQLYVLLNPIEWNSPLLLVNDGPPS